MNLKSKFLQEFFDRGYLAQCTDIQGLDNILASQHRQCDNAKNVMEFQKQEKNQKNVKYLM